MRRGRNNKLHTHAPDMQDKAHKSTVTFLEPRERPVRELDVASKRRNSMTLPPTGLPSHHTKSPHHTTRHLPDYALLGRNLHNSSVFSSHMAYNSSVMSMKLAQKESRNSSLKVREKIDDMVAIKQKAETDRRWRMMLDTVQSKGQFYRLACAKIEDEALALAKPLRKHRQANFTRPPPQF